MTIQGGLPMTDRVGADRGAAFRWRWALPLVPIAASMFCLSALVYYHTAMGGTGEAWGFFQSAVVASYRWLGFVPTFMFWLLLFVWCSIWFVTGRWEGARTRLTWMVGFTLCIAILVNLGTPTDPLPPHAGVVGTFVAVRLTSVIGYAFAALLAVAAALASLLLATDFLFYRYFEALARGRVADDVGVEPEATDAFRELAFAGVYADEPRAAQSSSASGKASGSATAGAALAGIAAAEDAVDVGPEAGGVAADGDHDSDLVVRPRWRRRAHRSSNATEPSDEPRPDDDAAGDVVAAHASDALDRSDSVGDSVSDNVGDSVAAGHPTAHLPAAASAVDAQGDDAQGDDTQGDDAQGDSDTGKVIAGAHPTAEVAQDDDGEDFDDTLVPNAAEFDLDDADDADDAPIVTLHGPAAGTVGEDTVTGNAGERDEIEPVVPIPRRPAPRPQRRGQGHLFGASPAATDELDRAAREVLAAGRASITLLRRHLGCTATEAIETLDALRAAGVIDGEPGSPNGRVLTTLADWEAR